MVKPKNRSLAEEKIQVAERQYQRMMQRVRDGIIDIEEIGMALGAINMAHRVALDENRRDLLK